MPMLEDMNHNLRTHQAPDSHNDVRRSFLLSWYSVVRWIWSSGDAGTSTYNKRQNKKRSWNSKIAKQSRKLPEPNKAFICPWCEVTVTCLREMVDHVYVWPQQLKSFLLWSTCTYSKDNHVILRRLGRSFQRKLLRSTQDELLDLMRKNLKPTWGI